MKLFSVFLISHELNSVSVKSLISVSISAALRKEGSPDLIQIGDALWYSSHTQFLHIGIRLMVRHKNK